MTNGKKLTQKEAAGVCLFEATLPFCLRVCKIPAYVSRSSIGSSGYLDVKLSINVKGIWLKANVVRLVKNTRTDRQTEREVLRLLRENAGTANSFRICIGLRNRRLA
jgi:hypothetical protein